MERNKSFSLISAGMLGLLLLGGGCVAGEPYASDVQPAEQTNQENNVIDTDMTDQTAKTTQDEPEQPAIERPPVPQAPVGVLPDERIANKQVRIDTGKGDIVFELYADEAPKTVSNFVALAESGYFDGLTFHRVEPNFVIQGGDPLGNGRGGPGYRFEDEPVSRPYLAGTVAMANSGPDTNGSQFFICLEDQPGLPPNYTIFGQVTSGMNAVRAIAIGDVMEEVVVEPLAEAQP